MRRTVHCAAPRSGQPPCPVNELRAGFISHAAVRATLLFLVALSLPSGLPLRAAGHDHDAAPAGPQVQTTFRVYGDAGFKYDSRPPVGVVKGSFLVGALDFFASAQIEDHVRVLAETGVEYEPATNEAGIDLERLYGSYTLDDRLYLKIGREHSAVSRWDRRYHHGKLFWPSLTKPFLARFEDQGGPLPIHHVGLEIGGRAESKI